MGVETIKKVVKIAKRFLLLQKMQQAIKGDNSWDNIDNLIKKAPHRVGLAIKS